MKDEMLYHLQLFLHRVLNFLLNPIGLYVAWTTYLEACDETEERQAQQINALKFEVAYLKLERRADALCYWLTWAKDEPIFTLHAGDNHVEFEATFWGIEEAKAIIVHDELVEAGKITDTMLMDALPPVKEGQS